MVSKMKSVLISIQPKWVEKIASGQKTIEVRKTAPKLKVPFKGYIYATKAKKWFHSGIIITSDELLWLSSGKIKMCDGLELWADGEDYQCVNGKVIGEFICDKVIKTCGWRLRGDTQQCAKRTTDEEAFPELACLTIDEIVKYAGSENREVCGLHISDLKIYDKPKELSKFKRPLDMPTCGYTECGSYEIPLCAWLNKGCEKRIITRAPQSWQYVEELEE